MGFIRKPGLNAAMIDSINQRTEILMSSDLPPHRIGQDRPE